MSEEFETKEVSNRIFILLVVVAVLLSGFLFTNMLAKWREYDGYTPRTITVDALGKAYAMPDVAVLNVGVKSEGTQVKDIVKTNTDKINKILADLKTLGVEEKDIQTVSYNIYPKYDYTQDRGSFQNGYSLDQELKVKIRDFDNIGKTIEKTTTDGANIIGSLQFLVDDDQKYIAQAREDAIKKIKEKIKSMEEQSGIHFGKVVSMYEYQDQYPQPMYSSAKMDIGGVGGGGESIAPSIQPGQNEVQLRVSLEYRLE